MNQHIDAWIRIVEDRNREILQEAQKARLLREAKKSTQTGWLTVQTEKAVNGLGHQLVGLGQRLENYKASTLALPDNGEPCVERDWKAI